MTEKQPINRKMDYIPEGVSNDQNLPSTVAVIQPAQFWISQRFLLAVVGFLGCFTFYSLRMDMSVAIICMTNFTAEELGRNISVWETKQGMDNFSNGDCNDGTKFSSLATKDMSEGEMEWNKFERGLLLGSFFWGYLIPQIPVGLCIQRFSPKMFLLLSMMFSSIATVLMPLASKLNFWFAFSLRVICGIASGVIFPCFHQIWANWAPKHESSKLIGICYAGVHLGNAFTLQVAGLLCLYGPFGGWPSVFYFFGALGFCWCLLWGFTCYDSPSQHPRISLREKTYIHSFTDVKNMESKEINLPLFDILKSPPMWAALISHLAFDYNGYLFLTSVPLYMKEILKLDISSAGILSSLPYIGFWIGQMVASVISDYLIEHEILSVTWTRKLMNSLGFFPPCLLLIALANFDCRQATVAIALLTLAMTFMSCIFLGALINYVDLAPRYSGVLMAICNTISSVTGFVAPTVVGSLTQNKLHSEWQLVFYISCGIFAIGGGSFLILASAEKQPWAEKKFSYKRGNNATGNNEEIAYISCSDDKSKKQQQLMPINTIKSDELGTSDLTDPLLLGPQSNRTTEDITDREHVDKF